MVQAIGEVITVLATVEFLLEEDESGTLPHEIDLHCVASELIGSVRRKLAEVLAEGA